MERSEGVTIEVRIPCFVIYSWKSAKVGEGVVQSLVLKIISSHFFYTINFKLFFIFFATNVINIVAVCNNLQQKHSVFKVIMI